MRLIVSLTRVFTHYQVEWQGSKCHPKSNLEGHMFEPLKYPVQTWSIYWIPDICSGLDAKVSWTKEYKHFARIYPFFQLPPIFYCTGRVICLFYYHFLSHMIFRSSWQERLYWIAENFWFSLLQNPISNLTCWFCDNRVKTFLAMPTPTSLITSHTNFFHINSLGMSVKVGVGVMN